MNKEKVYIIILNYNGWENTIECLESVLKIDYSNFQIIICDNNSTDNSFEKIIEWSEGYRVVEKTLYKNIIYPLEIKPIDYDIIDINLMKKSNKKLLFLKTAKNLGFAGGNNQGIKYAMKQNDFKYIWFLNNDTVVEKNSLRKVVEYISKSNKLGICGSKLLYYDNPNIVQGLAGRYNPFLGISKHIYNISDLNKISYIIGAAMLVKKEFLETVGLMNEFYFLYYEELDWVKRAENKFKIDVCLDSIVYHKEGASIVTRSSFSEYYLLRNRLIFTWIYYRKYIVSVFFRMVINIFHPYHKRPYNRIKMLKDIISDAYKIIKNINKRRKIYNERKYKKYY